MVSHLLYDTRLKEYYIMQYRETIKRRLHFIFMLFVIL